MNRPTAEDRRSLRGRAGLCARCCSLRVLENRRGSTFVFCGLSREDPSMPRYPPLPVLECRGFEKDAEAPEVPGSRGGGSPSDPPR